MIKLYTSPNCHFCDSVKKLLEEEKQDYMLVDISEDKASQEILKDQGFMRVPVIDINGTFIQGYDKPGILKALNLE